MFSRPTVCRKQTNVLQQTEFGWTISGIVPTNHSKVNNQCCHANDIDLQFNLNRFWEIEELNEARVYSEEELFVENHFKETLLQDLNGRFIVSIPFKSNLNEILKQVLRIGFFHWKEGSTHILN